MAGTGRAEPAAGEIKQYNGLWAGVWRSGSDGYYLWIDADQANFLAKWQELGAQGLRLIDFDVYTVNGRTLWAGVWRAGTDGYYLWINADWTSFQAKWAELAAQNLRLIAVQNYNGLWAGAWRSGTDAYYLWANVSEASFLAKWQEPAAQNLRLDRHGGHTGSGCQRCFVRHPRHGNDADGRAVRGFAAADWRGCWNGGFARPGKRWPGRRLNAERAGERRHGRWQCGRATGRRAGHGNIRRRHGWREHRRSGPGWRSGRRQRTRCGDFGGCHGGDGNRHRRRQRARHNERCQDAFRQ